MDSDRGRRTDVLRRFLRRVFQLGAVRDPDRGHPDREQRLGAGPTLGPGRVL